MAPRQVHPETGPADLPGWMSGEERDLLAYRQLQQFWIVALRIQQLGEKAVSIYRFEHA
jgi:hypothetical protein